MYVCAPMYNISQIHRCRCHHRRINIIFSVRENVLFIFHRGVSVCLFFSFALPVCYISTHIYACIRRGRQTFIRSKTVIEEATRIVHRRWVYKRHTAWCIFGLTNHTKAIRAVCAHNQFAVNSKYIGCVCAILLGKTHASSFLSISLALDDRYCGLCVFENAK